MNHSRLMRAGQSLRPRAAYAIVAAAVLSLAMPVLAYAHAVVLPRASLRGSRESFFLRVPNERDVPTVRIEIRFPDSLHNAMLAEAPGWKLEITENAAKKVSGAVWTGSLEPHRYVDLPFIGTNPRTGETLSWTVIQTYANGEVIEWSGAPGTKTPAAVTTLYSPPIVILGFHITAWVAGLAVIVSLAAALLANRGPRLAT